MSTLRMISRRSVHGLVVFSIVGALAAPASAQDAPRTGQDAVAFIGGIDVVSDYMFRGVQQNSTGIAMWPFGDLTVRAYSGDGPVKRIQFGAGFWNSVNTGDTGSGGPIAKAWYESRLYGTLGFQLGKGVSVATTYTAYTSPSDLFTTVREIGFKLGLDDRARAGRPRVSPYALVAFEINAAPGIGQLDGGRHAGRYLEIGVAPGYSARRLSLTFPVKLGLSLADYYELAGEDHAFGFFSTGGIVTVPLGGSAKVGRWNLHGGVEVQTLGETTKVFNGGDRSKVIASFGIGLSH